MPKSLIILSSTENEKENTFCAAICDGFPFYDYIILSGKKEGKTCCNCLCRGFRGLVNTDSINIWRLSHINYAFVEVKYNRVWLHNEATDTINLRKLSELKQRNQDIKIFISLGGWSWSKNFSVAVLMDTSIKNFANSAIDIMAKYNLDSVDIAGNIQACGEIITSYGLKTRKTIPGFSETSE